MYFICDELGKWKTGVNSVFFYSSVCDRDYGRTDTEVVLVSPPISCPQCCESFPTSKAMLAHSRRVHGSRIPQRFYATGSGDCPVCNSCFLTRLRLLAHLSDSRLARQQCWTDILANPLEYEKLDESTVLHLDAKDREAKRLARHQGHSHVRAVGQARSGEGKHVGHVQN